jgi:hypothetical protein
MGGRRRPEGADGEKFGEIVLVLLLVLVLEVFGELAAKDAVENENDCANENDAGLAD